MIDLEQLPVDITDHIRKFRNFLNACWPHLDALMEDHDWENDIDFLDDWLKVNWELLVERELLGKQGFLTQFSVTSFQSRMLFPDQVPTHVVLAKSDKQLFNMKRPGITISQNKSLRLFSFRTYKNNAFGLYPPFDLVSLIDDSMKELFIVPFDDVRFYLDAITPEQKERLNRK